MATIRRRSSGRWQAQVRLTGEPTFSKTFDAKADAVRWSKQIELKIETTGHATNHNVLAELTVYDIVLRYVSAISPSKRSYNRDQSICRLVERYPISKIKLRSLSVQSAAIYRDTRLKVCKPATVVREIAMLSHAFKVARREWNIPITENPFALVGKPQLSNARSRRLQENKWDSLKKACLDQRRSEVIDMIEFSIETAMRRGELLNMKWSDINLQLGTLHIPLTKNGHIPLTKNGTPRTIPLTNRARALIEKYYRFCSSDGEHVFSITDGALKHIWRSIILKSGIIDFKWHDLRHEAISRLATLDLTVAELALISGHKYYKHLARYIHLRPEALALKLSRITS